MWRGYGLVVAWNLVLYLLALVAVLAVAKATVRW